MAAAGMVQAGEKIQVSQALTSAWTMCVSVVWFLCADRKAQQQICSLKLTFDHLQPLCIYKISLLVYYPTLTTLHGYCMVS